MGVDDRPSIAELQLACRLIAEGKIAASDAIQDAAPVLLEIAAAASARMSALDSEDVRDVMKASERLRVALSKVRP